MNVADFVLDHRLAADTLPVCDLPLCRVLLMNDARFHWLVLVPRRPEAIEVPDLSPQDRASLMNEISKTGVVLRTTVPCDKLNIGALGNIVPQLHVHIVARRIGDAAWPGPVWGSGTAEPYPAGTADALANRIADAFGASPS